MTQVMKLISFVFIQTERERYFIHGFHTIQMTVITETSFSIVTIIEIKLIIEEFIVDLKHSHSLTLHQNTAKQIWNSY